MKILLLGSGALKIGQAGEFDYSGSQALKAFKEDGHEVVLINPNIATIQTSGKLAHVKVADKIYFLPVNPYFVEQVIKKEKVDVVAISFGGQTGLNTALDLEKNGVFKKYGVKVLGTSVESIRIAEDRDLFAKHLHKIGISTPPSQACSNWEQAQKAVKKIGYPVMIRAAYALGGQKSGVAHNPEQFEEIVKGAFAFAPQVLVEKYLHHWKEIEYEIVRDDQDNCIAVCNMENFDPLGVHTGDSIVIAPSQTLTNDEYQHLRTISIDLVRSLNIVGECNVQFALNPVPLPPKKDASGFIDPKSTIDYQVIELNPRLSRSSALASKATGYPLAYIAAKLILGKSLIDVQNQVTKVTQACFEPALDYLVVKIPRWDLSKFRGVDDSLGSSMKSVGEVMAIGRRFDEALQKAIRMLEIGEDGLSGERLSDRSDRELKQYLTHPTPLRLFAIVEAMRRGMSVSQVHKLTGIDEWFLDPIWETIECERGIAKRKLSSYDKWSLHDVKRRGVSDTRIATLTKTNEHEVRKFRKSLGVVPSVFQIDTLAGEFPAQTNYLYMTYNGFHYDVEPLGRKGVILLGSGPYRIGSSVEFDWTCVQTALALTTYKRKSIIINCNPETVSTDYDMSERLYFEQLTFERIADIYEFENPEGIIVSVGGQAPHNVVAKLDAYDIPILGTQAEDIDRAEDRSKFSDLCDKLDIKQPAWIKVDTIARAKDFARRVGYPVLIRPSYVLSGAAMRVCTNDRDLEEFIKKATDISQDYPVTISKYILEGKEIELDGVAQDGKIITHAMSEHVENAGVHSGDATIMFPPQRVYMRTEINAMEVAQKLCEELHITGPFNIQFIAIKNEIWVIEMNVRASRTFPFISKGARVNFARRIADAIYRKAEPIEAEYPNYVLIKVPQFSFSRLKGADPVLSVEMASTGEAACFGEDVEEAYSKAIMSVGGRIPPKKGIFISLSGLGNRMRFFTSLVRLKQTGLPIYATESTHKFLTENGIQAHMVYKLQDKKTPNAMTLFEDGDVDLAINITDINTQKDVEDGAKIRRGAIDSNVSLITNIIQAWQYIRALHDKKLEDLQIKAWDEYR